MGVFHLRVRPGQPVAKYVTWPLGLRDGEVSHFDSLGLPDAQMERDQSRVSKQTRNGGGGHGVWSGYLASSSKKNEVHFLELSEVRVPSRWKDPPLVKLSKCKRKFVRNET